MNILVTGAHGFVGKNLCATLNNIKENKDKSFGKFEDLNVFEYDLDTEPSLLDEYAKKCDFVFHLAGVNRPENQEDFMKGNFGFTSVLLEKLKANNNKAAIMISSSIQAELDNPYGQSKKAGEDLIIKYGKENNVNVYIYRFPNLFGKWCKPNYNSVIATFCNNIAHNKEITVNNESTVLNLVYIDDLVCELINLLKGNPNKADNGFYRVEPIYTVTLGKIAALIKKFKESRNNITVPDLSDAFEKKLYSTYLSYLPEDEFGYPLKMNVDSRGSFTEIIRTADRGQFSVNISKPGITKGNHWHHTKNEKFLVVSGKGVIRFRKVGESKVYEYFVSGDKLTVIDIPVGYTHNIENLGETDMVTFMWCNECFNPDKPDTFFLEV